MYRITICNTISTSLNSSASCRTRLEIILVVCIDCISAGNSRKNHLSSAAETCKEVEYDTSYKNSMVTFHSKFVYFNNIASGCSSHCHKIIAVTVVILMLKSCTEVFANKIFKVLFFLKSVCTDARNEKYIFIFNTNFFKLLNENMYNYRRSRP
ncbi:hypothetical protein IMSAG049_00426 [Clostridiales bacterium]|nr:hypothetical protein IMSAG049_00426 [Clostridiales bacterium]